MDNARQLPISIISGDVNGLKLTNDVFGHAHGDELIKTAARQLQNCCRSEDVVVRFGGAEFVVFLPQCNKATALRIIKQVQENCRAKTIEGIPVSLALGAATKTNPDENIYDAISLAETRMYQNKSNEVQRIRRETLDALERKVYKIDYTESHAERLRVLAMQFGDYLLLPPAMLADLETLATLHDIGKIAIPEQLINKPGPLTADEWELIKNHPAMGNRILRATRMVNFAVEEGVLTHHEHSDGTGYPRIAG